MTRAIARRRRRRETNSCSSGTSSRFVSACISRVFPSIFHGKTRPVIYRSLSLSLSLSPWVYFIVFIVSRLPSNFNFLRDARSRYEDISVYGGNTNIILSIIEMSLGISFFGERARVCRRRSMDSIGFSLSPSIHESWLAVSFQRNTLARRPPSMDRPRVLRIDSR